MYLDIPANDNLEEPAMATFKETGPGREVHAIKLLLDGAWQWCAITGWSDGPTAAWFTPIEESGDGPARLAHGGEHGLRLARISAPAEASGLRWSTDDRGQWGEPFLICTPDTEIA